MIWFAALALAGVPADDPVERAIAVDVTPDGLAAVAGLATAFVPETVAVPGFAETSSACLWGGYYYGVEISGLVITPTVTHVALTPANDGWLYVDASLTVTANSPTSPFALHTELLCIGDTCDGHIVSFPVDVHTGLRLYMGLDAGGLPALRSEVAPIEIVQGLSGDDIVLEGCSIGTIDDIFSFFGGSLYDLILPMVDDALNDAVAGLSADLSGTLDDALLAVALAESVPLGESVLDIDLAPTDAQITADGVRLVLGGALTTASTHPCVADWDPGESFAFDGTIPPLGAGPSPGHHLGVALSDELGNQALYAVWRAGLLCQEIGPGTDLGLPLALDTTLLGLLVGDVFAEVIPDPKPLTIRTRPEQAPRLASDRLGVRVETLGLEIYAEVEGRQARIVDINLDVEAGLEVAMDPTVGSVDLAIDLVDGVTPTVVFDELLSGRAREVEDQLKGTLESGLIAGIVEGLLTDLAIGLPVIQGLGLTSLDVAVVGDDQDWVGAYATVGEVAYTDEGCGGCGGETGVCGETGGCASTSGCGSTTGCVGTTGTIAASGCDCGGTTGTSGSCDGGCAIPGPVAGRAWVGLLGLVLALRRRR